jgi:SRSO17 transposase
LAGPLVRRMVRILVGGLMAEPFESFEGRLQEFEDALFSGLRRKDRRRSAGLYLRGLLLEDSDRRTMHGMASRLGVEPQRLQQFVTSSPWDHHDVQCRLARWMRAELPTPNAYIVDDVVLRKSGANSPGVERMPRGASDGLVNCQLAVGLHAVIDQLSVATELRLYLPESWDDALATSPETREVSVRRRVGAKVPAEVRYRSRPLLALEMLDRLVGGQGDRSSSTGRPCRSAGFPRRPVVAGAEYGDSIGFRLGLLDLGLDFVVAVSGETSASSAVAMAADRRALRRVTWGSPATAGTRAGSGGPEGEPGSEFMVLPIRPADGGAGGGTDLASAPHRLLVEWPARAPKPTGYWLCALPGASLSELVRLAKLRERVAHDVDDLRSNFGLADFEGRSYSGWHRHATLAAAARAFRVRLRTSLQVGAELP